MIDLTKALISLYPNSEWTLNGVEYDGLVWLSENIQKPTEAELIAECNRLQAEYEAKEYQRQRARAYPSIPDQLDLIYHQGIDAWKSVIEAVKVQYPKG